VHPHIAINNDAHKTMYNKQKQGIFELVHLNMRVTKKLMRSSNSKYNCLISSFSLLNIETREEKQRKEKRKGGKKKVESFTMCKKAL
jgi:hypothetical protein